MPANAPATHFVTFSRFSQAEQRALYEASNPPKRYQPNRALSQTNAGSPGVYLILSGFACRYSLLRTGERQILSFLVPGDLFDVRACFSDRADFLVGTLSPVEASMLCRSDFLSLANGRPELMRELWRLAAVEDATARQWLLNVGHRSALERLAHLLCEFLARLNAAGLAPGNNCHLPLTQRDIADALALSPVHVNRTLMELRRLGLIVFRDHRLTIPDLAALQETAGFDPRYLQLEGGPFSGGASAKAFESASPLRSLPFSHPSGSTPI